MKILVINYNSGNLKSVVNALEYVNERDNLQCEIFVSNDANDLKKADKIILPGVGSFSDCVAGIYKNQDFVEELKNQILSEKKKFFGICVGMQVLAEIGFENQETKGLGFIEGEVRKIDFSDAKNLNSDEKMSLKIPQMGWNNLKILQNHPILKEIEEKADVYFANSFHFLCKNSENIVAQVDYGIEINAIIAKENVVGVQFHPEKSGEIGLKILKNFLKW